MEKSVILYDMTHLDGSPQNPFFSECSSSAAVSGSFVTVCFSTFSALPALEDWALSPASQAKLTLAIVL